MALGRISGGVRGLWGGQPHTQTHTPGRNDGESPVGAQASRCPRKKPGFASGSVYQLFLGLSVPLLICSMGVTAGSSSASRAGLVGLPSPDTRAFRMGQAPWDTQEVLGNVNQCPQPPFRVQGGLGAEPPLRIGWESASLPLCGRCAGWARQGPGVGNWESGLSIGWHLTWTN